MEEGYVDTADKFDTGRGIWEIRAKDVGQRLWSRRARIYQYEADIWAFVKISVRAKIITKFYEGKEKILLTGYIASD